MNRKKKEIRTEIVIQARPEKVWGVLTSFPQYPQWNPFLKKIEGPLQEGAQITARIEPPGSSGMTFKPTLLVVSPARELRWLGHLFVPGLFDGEHVFELYENTDGSTTFVQREEFGGILVPLFEKMLDNNTLAGFNAMNQSLKARAEASR
ncbi:MAG: SRPBCC family protein [Bacteroidota bacterium]